MADRRKQGRRIAARRQQLEQFIEQAIEALDALDGDPDLEAEEDCCSAHDDDPEIQLRASTAEIGSEDDCEDSDDDCGPSEDEPLFPERGWAPWGPGRWGRVNTPCVAGLTANTRGGFVFKGERRK